MNNEEIQNYLNERAKLEEQLKLLESIAKKKMTKQAISRYGNLKIAHPEIAIKAIATIAQLVQQNMIEEINDEQFKKLLMEIKGKEK